MTFTINLPQATVDRIQASGKYVETYVKKAVEAKLALSKVSLKDALPPAPRCRRGKRDERRGSRGRF